MPGILKASVAVSSFGDGVCMTGDLGFSAGFEVAVTGGGGFSGIVVVLSSGAGLVVSLEFLVRALTEEVLTGCGGGV